MKFKDQLLLLPGVVILMFNIAVLVVFISHFLNEDYSGRINTYYLLLICVVAALIFLLRILIIGKSTILDKYITRTKDDWIFILFISFVVATLITTWAIRYFSISLFIDFFSQNSTNSPLRWFDLLNNNFYRLAFYGMAFVLVNYPFIYFFNKLKNNQKIKDDSIKAISITLGILGIFIFIALFISDPMIYFWDKIIKINIIKKLLSFIFGSSLLIYNLFFLFKKYKQKLNRVS